MKYLSPLLLLAFGFGAEAPRVSGPLLATGVGEARAVIEASGFDASEAPEWFPENHPGVPHITQVMDEILGRPVFAFHIHLQDRSKDEPKTDRQRNEIKTMKGSADHMVGTPGETHRYAWLMRLPAGFKPTRMFSHLHQIKAVDGDDDIPFITLTARRLSSGVERMEVIYSTPKSADPRQPGTPLATAPLAPFLDRWVAIEETLTFTAAGAYAIQITEHPGGRPILSVRTNGLVLWREGNSLVRPKWGIYRGFGENGSLKSQMRDEVVRFSGFTIREWPKP